MYSYKTWINIIYYYFSSLKGKCNVSKYLFHLMPLHYNRKITKFNKNRYKVFIIANIFKNNFYLFKKESYTKKL